jgi:hypothetical protein
MRVIQRRENRNLPDNPARALAIQNRQRLRLQIAFITGRNQTRLNDQLRLVKAHYARRRVEISNESNDRWLRLVETGKVDILVDRTMYESNIAKELDLLKIEDDQEIEIVQEFRRLFAASLTEEIAPLMVELSGILRIIESEPPSRSKNTTQ